VRERVRGAIRRVAVLAAATGTLAGTLTGCTSLVDGTPSLGKVPDARLSVVGDSHDQVDTTSKNALSDVLEFWKTNYPSVSGGKSLQPIKGGLFSIDAAEVVQTGKVSGAAAREKCIAEQPDFIIDNAAYCSIDDSIVWDRNPDHLIGVLSRKYGSLLLALVFAHEFGHAIQYRLGTFAHDIPVIQTESQADCAAGAFLADVVKGETPHFRTTPEQLDDALNGYLQVRDKTPTSERQISHGNGFDRLSALNDGLEHGPTFCYSSTYFDRKFTERPFVTDQDYQSGGNETLEQVLNPGDPTKDDTAGGLQPDLNRFWLAAAKSINKPWKDVTIAAAEHPKCGATSSASEFGYCPDDNTVYYSGQFASEAYNSLTELSIDTHTGNVTLAEKQPADFALGTLFAIGWGMAVRHQLFNRGIDGTDALLSAACYSGAYAKNINIAEGTNTQTFILSPPDMDEAVSAMLNLVSLDKAYGARGTTGLQRVQSFVKGYNGGLSVC
jgi:predicted metalloprotease